MLRIAYLGGQNRGGTFRVFETLRAVLSNVGFEVALVNPHVAGYRGGDCDGVGMARALTNELEAFDAVIVNVFMTRVLMNIARYLPPRQPRLMIVHNVTRATYLAARELQDYVDHTIAISPRIRNDLVERYGFAPESVTTIFHGVPEKFFAAADIGDMGGNVRLLSLGRLNDNAKRVSKIPKMIDPSIRSRVALTIGGDGPDRASIEHAFVAGGVDAEFLGAVVNDEVPALVAAHEVFLFPSRFEGLGIALAEAMAAGLVPVAARIRGVTDAVIEEGVSGFLFAQSDWATARQAVTTLVEDPDRRMAMRRAARERALALFRIEGMGHAYAEVLDRIIREPRAHPSLPLSAWTIPPGMRPGLRSLVPTGIRRWLADRVLYRG